MRAKRSLLLHPKCPKESPFHSANSLLAFLIRIMNYLHLYIANYPSCPQNGKHPGCSRPSEAHSQFNPPRDLTLQLGCSASNSSARPEITHPSSPCLEFQTLQDPSHFQLPSVDSSLL
jgi:hypothetical protein